MADCYSCLLRYLQFTGLSCQFVSLFTGAPRGDVTLYCGNFIKNAHRNGQRGARHGATLGANAAIPVVAKPGIHGFAELDPKDTVAKSVPSDVREFASPPEGIRRPASKVGASLATSKLRGLS
jgi:hypothetical protein